MMEQIYNAWIKRFEELEPHLNALDAATGDGDHGSTMVRGIRAAGADQATPVKAFRKAAGGASGSLFSLLIGALDKAEKGDAMLPDALAAAAERINQMGQAVAGDKTMLDALIPASLESNIDDALAAARSGCNNTIDMPARRGRAKYVEGAGVGHIDAGATSVVELLVIFAQFVSPENNVTNGDVLDPDSGTAKLTQPASSVSRESSE